MGSILQGGFAGYRQFVNSMVALRGQLLGEPWQAVRAADGRLMDGDRAFEDFHGTQSFGHRNRHVTDAVREFLDSDAVNWYPARVSPFAGSLAERLCGRANRTVSGPRPAYDNVFFGNSGSDGIEAAIKLARAATGRPRILALAGAYHGCTMGSCALMQPGMFRDPFAPHLPGAESLPFADEAALAGALAAGDVAAVVVEPIQLEGGVNPLPPSYIDALCGLSERHGALLVADEVQTGLGRTGRFLATEVWPRRPDAVVLAKHLGGGLLPISAMMTRTELFDRAYGRSYAAAEAHNTTFGGNAMACVAAHAALDLLDDELIARNGRVGAWLRGELAAALAGCPLVEEIRGDGMMLGLALRPIDHPWLSFEHLGVEGVTGQPSVGVLLCFRLYRRGYYCFVCGHRWDVLRVQPRFDIEEAALAGFVRAVREELDYLCSQS